MKLLRLYALIVLLIFGFFLTADFSVNQEVQPYESNEQIIIFSHSFHSDLAECEDCHSAVAESTSLTDRLLPNHENCGSCHDVEDEEECSTCHIDEIYEPLIQKKSSLIFSHSFHLNEQNLKCESCHKGITDVDYAFQADQPTPIMENCFSCHNNESIAPNACESCHISTANLLPQDHRVSGFIQTHKFSAASFDANCVMCHDNNSCQECHVSTTMITESNTANDFYQPYAPTNFKDGVKQQQITRVHELNYRFTHGIDAEGKNAECQSCHQIETFCTNCHQADNSDFAMSGIVPASHLKSDFVTIGVGTGGGEHSLLARRDIESCVACHDVQGADPTCITCHLDSDGIKGTNPKTHPSGFMRDTHGDWHESQGSICFNCHVSASPSTPPGINFCGYCHGAK